MPTPDPGSLFEFNIPATNTPVVSAEVRDNFTALAQTNFTSDGTTPASPQKGMTRINGANPNNWLFQVWNGSNWQTLLQNIQLGIPAPVKSITNIAVPANAWTITHNLGSQVLVMAFDSSWYAFEIVGFGSGGGTATPTTANKNQNPTSNISTDGVSTGLAMAFTPAGYVGVFVDGYEASVGDGVKVGVDCYFSGDGGVTPRPQAAIQATDLLYWNGASAFPLATTDRVDFWYSTGAAGGMGPKQCTVQQTTANRVVITFAPGNLQTGFVVIIG
jgi:hypothetical protein